MRNLAEGARAVGAAYSFDHDHRRLVQHHCFLITQTLHQLGRGLLGHLLDLREQVVPASCSGVGLLGVLSRRRSNRCACR